MPLSSVDRDEVLTGSSGLAARDAGLVPYANAVVHTSGPTEEPGILQDRRNAARYHAFLCVQLEHEPRARRGVSGKRMKHS